MIQTKHNIKNGNLKLIKFRRSLMITFDRYHKNNSALSLVCQREKYRFHWQNFWNIWVTLIDNISYLIKKSKDCWVTVVSPKRSLRKYFQFKRLCCFIMVNRVEFHFKASMDLIEKKRLTLEYLTLYSSYLIIDHRNNINEKSKILRIFWIMRLYRWDI